jgi:pimeloyl-ACP methyl ester carboxylesterase
MRIPALLLGLLFALPASAEYADVHGMKMYYEVHGAGRPVVLLHGGATTIRLSFEKQIPVLAQNHRVIAIEQMGHGHTADVPGRDFTYEGMTEDTAALLNQLGIRNADVIGWSDGGRIALRLAFTHPELVRRVIASGVGLSAPTPEVAEIIRKYYEALSPETWWPPAIAEYARISPDGPEHWPVVFGKLRAMWMKPSRGVSQEDLAKIKAPTLIVAGDEESVERSTAIFRAIPGAKLCILPGTNHLTFIHRPEWMNLIILDFLDQN